MRAAAIAAALLVAVFCFGLYWSERRVPLRVRWAVPVASPSEVARGVLAGDAALRPLEGDTLDRVLAAPDYALRPGEMLLIDFGDHAVSYHATSAVERELSIQRTGEAPVLLVRSPLERVSPFDIPKFDVSGNAYVAREGPRALMPWLRDASGRGRGIVHGTLREGRLRFASNAEVAGWLARDPRLPGTGDYEVPYVNLGGRLLVSFVLHESGFFAFALWRVELDDGEPLAHPPPTPSGTMLEVSGV